MKQLKILYIAVLGILAAACSLNTGTTPAYSMRVSLQTTQGGGSEAKVLLEGSDGNLLNGSSVSIENGEGSLVLLDFDFSRGGYVGTFPPSSAGTYRIRARSLLFSEVAEMNVPHIILSSGPVIDTLRSNTDDGIARDSFSGERLQKTGAITVGWEPVEGASVYQVEVRTGTSTEYVGTSATSVCIVPAGTLTMNGMHTIRITAQYLSGDPLFTNDGYWSFSQYAGTSVMFETE